jgi:O-antigen ligase
LACYLLADDRRLKRVSACTTVLAAIALALTQSRAPYLAFGMTIIFAIWYFAQGRKKKLALIAGFLILAIAIYSLCIWFAPKRFEVSDDHSVFVRLMLWGAAWTMFQSSPAYGVGFGTFPFIYDRYLPPVPEISTGLEAHNVYVELLAETGLLGLLTFFFLIGRAIREASRSLRSADWMARALAFGMASGILAVLLESFFDHNLLWAGQIGSLFWLLLGMVGARSAIGVGLSDEERRVCRVESPL